MEGKINLKTAFFWRHKILEVMKNFDNHDKLDGIVEADETYFNESQKGNKNITNRKPRKRGFSRLMYLVTFALAGFGLAINVQKISLLDFSKEVKDEGERKFIEWLYFIRIGAEFFTEILVCYIVYSLKKSE